MTGITTEADLLRLVAAQLPVIGGPLVSAEYTDRAGTPRIVIEDAAGGSWLLVACRVAPVPASLRREAVPS